MPIRPSLVTSGGKKKSKFKAFKDFFVKKKKREPVDVYRGRSLKSSFSSLHFNKSSLNLAQEGQQSKSKVKGNMETKSLSHESTFMLDPEPEMPASKMNPSPELQRGRSLERSHVSRTLSSAGGMSRAVSGTLHEVVPHYVSRSGIWVSGSKITEIPPMRSQQPSIRPPVTGSETICKDFEKISVGAQPPKTPRKALSQKILSLKSSFEPSSGPIRSQSLTTFAVPTSPSSTQLPIGFSTPATTQACLDSSASEHKMALNPQKQKKKNPEATVKPKQEELSFPLVSEEKTKTKPKATYEKKPKKDSAGPLAQEQSNNTEISKTTDQATKTDATGSQGYSAYGKQSGKKGSSASEKIESRPRGRSSKKSSRKLDLGNRAESPSAYKIARDSHFWRLPLEKQVAEQPIALQAEAITPQELLSDKNYMERRKAGLDYETRKASLSHPIPKHMNASMISGPSQYHEGGASGTKSEARASLLSVVESPSTAQEDVMFSVAGEAQVCMGPSHIRSEEEDASSFDSQSVKLKMESAQNISNICKKKPPGNVLQAFPASILGMASDLPERSISVERLPPRSLSRSLGKPEAKEVSDADNTSEMESDSESASEKGSASKQQLAPSYVFQSLGEPEDDEEGFTESSSFVGKLSSSHEQLAPSFVSQALGEPKDEVSTESNSYLEKYSTAKDWSSSEEDLPPRHPSLAPGKPKDQKEVFSVSKNTAEEWGVSVEQVPPRRLPQPFVRPFVQQQLSTGSVNTSSEWVPMPSRHIYQPWLKPKPKQQASSSPESTVVEGRISMEPLPPKLLAHPVMNPKVEENVFLGSEGAEKVVSVEPSFSEYCPECLTNPEAQHIVSENTAGNEGMFVELLPPKCPCQPLVKLNVQPENTTCDSGSASKEWSSPMEVMPSRHSFYPYVNTSFEQPSASPKSTAVEWGIPMEPLLPRMPSQPLMRPIAQQKVFEHSLSAPAQWSGLVEPIRPTYTSQPGESPKFEQQAYTGPESTVVESSTLMEPLQPRLPSEALRKPISTGPESVANERDTSTELPPPRHWSIVRHKVQKMSPRFEKAAVERVISGRAQPPKYPIHFLNFKAQKVSSDLQNTAVEGGMSKKSLLTRCPSQSFVKYMAQHIFSESPDKEQQVYVDPLASNQPSKSLLGPKVEHQVLSGWESADIEGGISSKLLPTKGPLQSLERPENLQEVFSYSESAPVKWSCPQEQWPPRYLSQTYEKFEHKQEVSSVSQSSLEEWRSSEEQQPSRVTFQAEGGAEFQPQILSTGSVSVPIECSSAGHHLPPRQPFQAFAGPEYEQQVYSSSMSAAAKATIFESDSSTCSLPKGPDSPNETIKHSHGSEDLIKNIPTSATKPVKSTVTPAWPTSISRDSYPKEEVLESSDQNDGCSSLSTSEADVKNLFGVRLRRIPSSQKYKSKEQEHFTKLSSPSLGPMSTSVGGEPQIRSASKGLLHTEENLTAISDFAEKKESKPKSDSMPKKQPAYKIPGKIADRQSDYATSEPAWITLAKQKQRKFQTEITMEELKASTGAGPEAETKVASYEGAGCVPQNQPRKIFTSDVTRQEIEQMALPKSTDPGFENQKIFQVPAMRKETRHSSAHPAMFQEPAEPVWFSMAKKKAKAWSYITEIMQ
ncbi:acrosomal protein KIAA1210 homolog [Phyllostomus hastatus]|uniref:acrosomal protein KIAA1210 homolog n=1 Tax=Phyllostomus hastatus TaxID=9423 RepID=UPI001E683614|nr:acrosomal protein KIAA1210 homolog [Phyllostomus hastatus]